MGVTTNLSPDLPPMDYSRVSAGDGPIFKNKIAAVQYRQLEVRTRVHVNAGISGRPINKGAPGIVRRAHNPKVAGSNPAPATRITSKPGDGLFQTEEAFHVSTEFGHEALRGWAENHDQPGRGRLGRHAHHRGARPVDRRPLARAERCAAVVTAGGAALAEAAPLTLAAATSTRPSSRGRPAVAPYLAPPRPHRDRSPARRVL
jgi:hypothetical protein